MQRRPFSKMAWRRITSPSSLKSLITYSGLLQMSQYVLVTESAQDVYENGLETNNKAESSKIFDVVTRPYADLTVTSVEGPATADSGNIIRVTWEVKNQGIGITDTASWVDMLYLVS